MASNVRAAPLGCFRPCSQPCKVRTDTPISAANCDCESPVLCRASITGEETTRTCPAFISRTDCRSSAARSRLASYAVSSASVRGLLFEGTANLLQLWASEVVRFGLRIKRKQDDFTFGCTSEIDHPHAARLARTCATPSHFANATGFGHDISGSGMLCNVGGENAALLFAPVERPLALKEEGFDDCEHCRTIRQRRTAVQKRISRGRTFDMRGKRRRHQRGQNAQNRTAVVCPLDGMVRPLFLPHCASRCWEDRARAMWLANPRQTRGQPTTGEARLACAPLSCRLAAGEAAERRRGQRRGRRAMQRQAFARSFPQRQSMETR
ncbi:hypothetical protein DES47_1101 [Roseateles toxinivorans]|uniref:Uncharacterized protein n=1 Tax=Roseateles toxinivorans TaxID=270368 RepID=A0A4R6QI88_9BURK|nr:hypothetical protein DES47_1101 [Roseateles toxinivorans]